MTNFRKTRLIAARTIEGQAYIINTRTSMLHELDSTGTFLWEKIKSKHDEVTLTTLLMDEYDVESQTARIDVCDFLKTLQSLGLIEQCDE
ncbi:MAG: PqqD family protein [Endomicrobiales bacterium]